MRANALAAVLAAVFLSVPVASGAQAPPIRPGLWQMKMERGAADQGRMREMEERMKSMPPEERKQLEGIMKQHGVHLGDDGGIKVCLDKDSLARNAWRGGRDEGGCKTQTTRGAKVWKFRTTCPAPSASETVGEATFVSDTQYTVKSTTTVDQGGQKKTTRMTGTSNWLGADCGDLRPMKPPAKHAG